MRGDWGEVGEVRARLAARGEGGEFMALWARVSSSWMRQGGARPLCCATLRRLTGYRVLSQVGFARKGYSASSGSVERGV